MLIVAVSLHSLGRWRVPQVKQGGIIINRLDRRSSQGVIDGHRKGGEVGVAADVVYSCGGGDSHMTSVVTLLRLPTAKLLLLSVYLSFKAPGR